MVDNAQQPLPPPNTTLPLSQRVVSTFAVLAAMLLGAVPVSDGDAVMHAAIGRWMVRYGQLLPTPDPLVWTDRGGDHQHEWLAQLLLGAMVQLGGLGALRVFGGLVAAVCAWLLVRLARRHGVQAGVVVGLWLLAVQPHLAPRPHLLGWALAIAVLGFGVLTPQPWSRRAALGWLAVMALWANLHSSALIAPVYALLVMIDRAWLARQAGQPLPWRDGLLRFTVCGVGALLQPLGPLLPWYVWQSQQIGAGLSDEWLPLLAPDVLFSQPFALFSWALALALLAVATRRTWRGTLAAWPGALAGLVAILHAAVTRRMAIFLFIPLLFGARALPSSPWLGAATLAGSVAVLAPRASDVLSTRAVRQGSFPEAATAFLQRAHLQGRLFNPDPWGGWLAWNLTEPAQSQVFLDGRLLLGGRQVVLDLIAMQVRNPLGQKLLANYDIEVLVQRTGDYLQVPPPDPQQWFLAWRDGQAVVLVRKGPHWQQNWANIAAALPELERARRTHWPRPMRGPPGMATPTDIRSVFDSPLPL